MQSVVDHCNLDAVVAVVWRSAVATGAFLTLEVVSVYLSKAVSMVDEDFRLQVVWV